MEPYINANITADFTDNKTSTNIQQRSIFSQ